jgi:hypothetical protein
VTISPIRDSKGVIVGASKIARDITERKRAGPMTCRVRGSGSSGRKSYIVSSASHRKRSFPPWSRFSAWSLAKTGISYGNG